MGVHYRANIGIETHTKEEMNEVVQALKAGLIPVKDKIWTFSGNVEQVFTPDRFEITV